MEANKYYSYFRSEESFFVVIDFFYFISDSDFKKILGYISEKTGFADGIKGMFFSNSFEEWAEEYFKSGVMVYFNDKEVIINTEIFKEYFSIAVKIFLENYKGDKDGIHQLVDLILKTSFD
jgi:hypothetical protein